MINVGDTEGSDYEFEKQKPATEDYRKGWDHYVPAPVAMTYEISHLF
jgi:hypothetical protein